MRLTDAIIGVTTALLLAGCSSFYDKTGSSITAGDVSAPVEVSDGTGAITVRALFSMTGMKMWAANGQNVCFAYDHTYTNEYLYGLVRKRGTQGGRALVVGTNDFHNAIQSFNALNADGVTKTAEGAD